MIECKDDAELSVMIVNMLPTKDRGRFLAVGRVFSGVLHKDQEVFIMGVDYKYGQKADLYQKKVGKLYIINDDDTMEVDYQVSSGNIVGIMGIDEYIVRTGTLTSSLDINPFRVIQKESTLSVIRCIKFTTISERIREIKEKYRCPLCGHRTRSICY